MAGCMVFLGFINYLDGYFGTHEIRNAQFEMTNLNMFINDKYYDEQVAEFQFNLKADISDLFNWNTNVIFLSVVCEFETEDRLRNQIVVWDQRIMREMTEFYHLDLKNEWVEYYLTDVKKSLKGKKVNVFLRWEQMTTIGPYYNDKKRIGEFTLPNELKSESKKRAYKAGPSSRIDNY
jgi:hypothetical protein